MAGQTIQLWDYWFILRKRKFMILATLAVVLLVVTLVNSLQKPIYSARADLIVEINQPTRVLGTQSPFGQTSLDTAFFGTQALLMQSSFFAGLVADELDKNRSELSPDLQSVPRDNLTRLSRALISVPTSSSARIIYITVENTDPKLAAFLANTIAKVYVRYTQQSQIESSKQMFVFLTQKLEEIRDKLKDSSYTMTEADIEGQLAAASKIYGDKHPIVIELNAKKKAIEDNLLRERASSPAQPQPPEGQKGALLSGNLEKDKYAVSRSIKINEELYQVFLRKLQELNVTGDVAAYNVKVIETAKVPAAPVRPNKRLNMLIGLLMGTVMGVGLAFFRQYLDTTIKTVEELKNGFGMVVLGLIPTIGQYKPKSIFEIIVERFFDKEKKEVKIDKKEIHDELTFKVHRLASAEVLQAPIAEAYRTLRTNLQFAELERPLKTLLVTSSVRGEGKTTTSINLAIILAQTGKKILLVDTDLRRPRIHKAFGTGREVGITNLLMGESRLEDVVIPADVPNLSILPSGPLPPNPAELVASERMGNLIRHMESNYDLIIFDSPPLVAVTDAALLAKRVDGLLMVVESGALPRELFKQGLDRLHNVKANIIGCVLNNVNLQKGSYYYYYYHYYHYDYDTADKV